MTFEDYTKNITEDIHACISQMNCQPILFIGSGLSRRYFNAPNWEVLLKTLAKQCPLISKPWAFYKQNVGDLIDIGSTFTELFASWAWEDQSQFPPELFDDSITKDMYLKWSVSKIFDDITPTNINQIPVVYNDEIKSLQSICPHAIITTNYDQMLEIIFPDYTPIIGEKVLRSEATSVGEIFKIHGCSTNYQTIVINRDDYLNFQKKKKYLSAKLLTCFAEHPLLFVGYGAGDSNIKAILSDIDELLCPNDDDVVNNIYFLDWDNRATTYTSFPQEKIIQLDDDKKLRVKYIIADSFEWVFKAFSVTNAIERVHPKLLRALLARTYELIRTDIPKNKVDVDYNSLQVALETHDSSKIFGITSVANPEAFNIQYPYTLNQVAEQIGLQRWQYAQKLLDKLKEANNIDIKAFDNKYHVKIKSSKSGYVGKYSQEAVLLLKKIKDGEIYQLNP